MKPNVDSSLRRSYGLATTLVAAIQTLVASAPLATGGLPEPDTVFFGTIAIDNAFVTAVRSDVTVELRRTPDGAPLSQYRMGDDPNVGNRYTLRARVESEAPVEDPDASVLGATLWITVSKNGTVRDQTSQTLTHRGAFVPLNFGDLDSDGDGIQDGWESAYFGSSTAGDPLADPDGDYRSNLQEFLDGTDPITADGRHPADAAPANWQMTLGEVTAYAAAWLRGEPWPTGPQPANALLVDFVTAAGTLWLGGEHYVFDNLPPIGAPLWWTNAPPAPALAGVSKPDAKASPVSPRRALAGLGTDTRGVTVRTASDALTPGTPLTITLTVIPSESVEVYAVEERLPEGWTVHNVNATGSSDPRLARIRWGPFFDSTTRTFTYQATPPAVLVGAFTGVASFDGRSIGAEGLSDVSTPGTSATLTLRLVSASDSTVQVSGAPGTDIVLQVSQDLKLWTQVGAGRLDGEGSIFLPTAPTHGPTFFRALRAPSSP
jgi:hypothetical protein